MTGPIFCDGLDVARNAEGQVFVRLWNDGRIVAVAGFSVENALGVGERLSDACEASIMGRPLAPEALH